MCGTGFGSPFTVDWLINLSMCATTACASVCVCFCVCVCACVCVCVRVCVCVCVLILRRIYRKEESLGVTLSAAPRAMAKKTLGHVPNPAGIAPLHLIWPTYDFCVCIYLVMLLQVHVTVIQFSPHICGYVQVSKLVTISIHMLSWITGCLALRTRNGRLKNSFIPGGTLPTHPANSKKGIKWHDGFI